MTASIHFQLIFFHTINESEAVILFYEKKSHTCLEKGSVNDDIMNDEGLAFVKTMPNSVTDCN